MKDSLDLEEYISRDLKDSYSVKTLEYFPRILFRKKSGKNIHYVILPKRVVRIENGALKITFNVDMTIKNLIHFVERIKQGN